MSSIFDKYAPLKTVIVKPRTSNPWFTSNLRSEKDKDDNWNELGVKPVMNQTSIQINRVMNQTSIQINP